MIWAVGVPVPDVLIANDGRSFAIRGAEGRLVVHHTGGDTFAIREWLAADADGRDVSDRALGQGIACDPSGCVGKLADGARIAYALTPDAFDDDCREAVLVVAARTAPPPGCTAMVIDRDMWRARGALALRRAGTGFIVDSARAASFDRPWSAAWSPAWSSAKSPVLTPSRAGAASADRVMSSDAARSLSRDATPQPEDVEADQ
jgi:competence protein ComEC